MWYSNKFNKNKNKFPETLNKYIPKVVGMNHALEVEQMHRYHFTATLCKAHTG